MQQNIPSCSVIKQEEHLSMHPVSLFIGYLYPRWFQKAKAFQEYSIQTAEPATTFYPQKEHFHTRSMMNQTSAQTSSELIT